MRNAVILVIVALLAPTGSAGQSPPPLEVGERIRVHLGNMEPVTGQLTGRTERTLLVSVAERASREIELDRITGLERSLGVERNFLKGFLPTVAIFAAAGTGLAAATWSPCETGWCILYPSRGQLALMGAATGAGLGLIVGIIVGNRTTSERWESMDSHALHALARAVRVGASGQVGLEFSVALGGGMPRH